MEIRRPVVALFVALALVGGGSAIAGCSAAGDAGTTDDSGNTSGGNPGGVSQGNLPNNHAPASGNDRDEDSGNNG